MLRVAKNAFYFSIQSFNSSKDYYKILNIDPSATPQAIKSSYKTLAKKYHPDVNKGKEEQFKEVNQAYQILSDTNTKREYDQIRVDNSYSHRQQYSNVDQRYGRDNRGSRWENQRGNHYEQQSYNRGFGSNYNPNNDHQNPSWNSRDQWLYEFYKKQQSDFMNRYQQAQRQRFDRGRGNYRSPIQDEYMRRFMEDLAAREEIRKMKEEVLNEKAREEMEDQQRVEREYQESKKKLKAMSKELGEGVKNMARGVWSAWLQLKRKK